MENDWQIEDFEEMNPPAVGQRVSPLEHLSRIGAASGEFLGIAQNILDSNALSVVCFAQLPYRVGNRVQHLTRPGTSRLFELHFYPAIITINDNGSQRLLGVIQNSNTSSGIDCTQILGVVKYWGIRAKWYRHYASKVTAKGLQGGQIVPAEESWLELHQPLDAAAFENNLARRLLGDFLVAIRRALPIELLDSYSQLLNYFIMPYPGRISFGGKPIPTLRNIKVFQPFFDKQEAKPVINKKQSVFLSYGGPDTEIAEALRTDLEKNGIDTWWFPSNAQWGERLHHEISKNIKKYDRLLLLCSRRSLIRNGVLHEIEEVFDREAAEGGKAIIIPVALDNVLAEQWWKYEPDQTGQPVIGAFSDGEIARRQSLATAINRRVVGDLKDAMPGDEKWKFAIRHLVEAL